MKRFIGCLLSKILLLSIVIAALPGMAMAADILMLDSTVSFPATSSKEYQALMTWPLNYSAGDIDIVDNNTWAGMTAAQFGSYKAIILGDPWCSDSNNAVITLTANAMVWGPEITGNVVIVGTDPTVHPPGGTSLTNKGIEFAVDDPNTVGAYITLSCYYHGTTLLTPVPFLDGLSTLGNFSVVGVGCYNDAHIVATHPALSGLTDTDLSNWSCSVHEAFDTWPADFVVLAIAQGAGGTYNADDGTVGIPYILARGEDLVPVGNNSAKWRQPPDESPMGIDIRIDRSDGVERILADDFLCTTTGPITNVNFWGSWNGDRKGVITKIHLSFHKDIPAVYGGDGTPLEHSRPGELLWEHDFDASEFTETLHSQLPDGKFEWWWDVYDSSVPAEPNGDQQIWRYDINIDPSIAFVQEGDPNDPLVYWLDVYVEVQFDADLRPEFGWKTSITHWNDDAVYGYTSTSPITWMELVFPPEHPYEPNSIDMAFVITTDPIVDSNEACCLPDGTCYDVPAADCILKGGLPQGPGSDCATTECPTPAPIEACCLPDGSCTDVTNAECMALHGTPQGPNSNCATADCPQPCEIPPITCPDTNEPAVVITQAGGLPDNFAPMIEAASPDTILLNYIVTCSPSGVPLKFDQIPGEGGVLPNSWLGHTFTGLPAGIVAARLEFRARATTGLGASGTNNDHISIVNSISGCTPNWAWSSRLENLPEAGGSWKPGDVETFCLDLDALPVVTATGGEAADVSVLSMLASGQLDIRVDDDSGIDYMILTVAICPCEYSYPGEVTAGKNDNCKFSPPMETPSPSTELVTAFGGTWRRFDQIVSNRKFGHTFTGLPANIVAAELELCLRAGTDIPTNDRLYLEFLNPSFSWYHDIATLPSLPSLPPPAAWNVGQVKNLVLDLGNLPPSPGSVTSVLGELADGDLDIYIQDDTAVDYITLRYWTCCDKRTPGNLNDDDVVDWHDFAIMANHWLDVTPISGCVGCP